MDVIERVAAEFLHVYVDVAFFFLFGLVAAGLITAFVRRSTMRRTLGGRGFKPVVKASLLGIPMPLCSCSVVPMAVSLRRQGVSRGATVSFLVSTPETDVDSIAVTYALLGPLMAIVRPVAATLTAMAAGAIEVLLDRGDGAEAVGGPDACNVCEADESDGHAHGFRERLRRAFEYAFGPLFGDIIGWMLVGLVLASLVGAFMSPEWVQRTFASSGLQILAMLAVSVPLYVCATASTPVAASLIASGFSPGAALVLLLAGPATNVGTILMTWRFLGRRSALVYVAVIVVVSGLFGLALDAAIGAFAVDPKTLVGTATDALPAPVMIGAAVVLAALTLVHYARLAARRLARGRGRGACACDGGPGGHDHDHERETATRRRDERPRSVDTADAGS